MENRLLIYGVLLALVGLTAIYTEIFTNQVSQILLLTLVVFIAILELQKIKKKRKGKR